MKLYENGAAARLPLRRANPDTPFPWRSFMYQTPEVQDLGTVRALTLGGGSSSVDSLSVQDPDDNCYFVDPNTDKCVKNS